MKIRFTKNIAINTKPGANSRTADFYRALGLEAKTYAADFTAFGPAPFSCYVVSWSPVPEGEGEVCLQFETDDLEEVKSRVERGGGKILSLGPDRNNPGRSHLWFRDPAGNLLNVVEMKAGEMQHL